MEKFNLFFRILGLGTNCGNNERTETRFFSCAPNNREFLFRFLFVLTISIVLLKFSSSIYLYLDIMGAVNDVIKYSATMLATAIILLDSHTKGHSYCQLNELATQFHTNLQGFMKRRRLADCHHRFWQRYKLKFWSFSVFYILSELSLVPIYMQNPHHLNSLHLVMGNNLFIAICRYRHLQHILFMDLVHYLLQLTRKVLKEHRHTMTQRKLKQIQEILDLCVDMVRLQNKFFSLSQAMNLCFNHLQLLGDIYWFYFRYLNGGWTPGSFSKWRPCLNVFDLVR